MRPPQDAEAEQKCNGPGDPVSSPEQEAEALNGTENCAPDYSQQDGHAAHRLEHDRGPLDRGRENRPGDLWRKRHQGRGED